LIKINIYCIARGSCFQGPHAVSGRKHFDLTRNTVSPKSSTVFQARTVHRNGNQKYLPLRKKIGKRIYGGLRTVPLYVRKLIRRARAHRQRRNFSQSTLRTGRRDPGTIRKRIRSRTLTVKGRNSRKKSFLQKQEKRKTPVYLQTGSRSPPQVHFGTGSVGTFRQIRRHSTSGSDTGIVRILPKYAQQTATRVPNFPTRVYARYGKFGSRTKGSTARIRK